MANVAKSQTRPVGARFTKFLREARSELRKVTWPSRKELTTYTIVVLVVTSIVGLFLGIVDLVVSQLIGWLGRL